jgi:hypothetical protein
VILSAKVPRCATWDYLRTKLTFLRSKAWPQVTPPEKQKTNPTDFSQRKKNAHQDSEQESEVEISEDEDFEDTRPEKQKSNQINFLERKKKETVAVGGA